MMKNKLLALIFALSLLFGAVAFVIPAGAASSGNTVIAESDLPLRLWYSSEALKDGENSPSASTTGGANADIGWAQWSLPIGNGYFGANVFGRTETERIQITEKTLMNPTSVKDSEGNWQTVGGLNSFSETYIDFGHAASSVTDYERYLDLKTAISGVEYKYGGVTYSREYFTSYPDKALVIRLDASEAGKLDFTLSPTIPYLQSYAVREGDGVSKSGSVTSRVSGGVGYAELSGNMAHYGIDFLGIYKVYTDSGEVTASTAPYTYTDKDGSEKTINNGVISVSGAKSAYIVVTLGTDYELSSEIFTSADTAKPTKTTTLADTREKVEGYMTAIEAKISGKSFEEAYSTLKSSHVSDYSELFSRVSVDLGCDRADLNLTTDTLLNNYKNGIQSAYLEALLFQYGRYLLIASSRSGALPANLQGAWNTYNTPPWASAYTHNINVQMNYWPAFSTNIAETFEAYLQYNQAYMKQAKIYADTIINENNPTVSGKDGGNGWVVGNHIYPYRYTSDRSAGNLGFITQVFWEYYEYTRDPEVLKSVYSVLAEAARYITKCVKLDEDGNYLVSHCDSPEVHVNGVWYYTNGTTYAQTFAYLNNYHALLAAEALGIDLTDEAKLSTEEYSILKTVMEQIDKYDPIKVGLSGQIKEFREEDYYSSIGDDPKHRHISQLVGLFPGNIINSNTEAWLDAVKVTLSKRGYGSMGWSRAHRMALYARVKDGEGAYDLLESLIKERTAYNLWNIGPPFQIDGSFGLTAGVAEMLLQSHDGYISPLPALPEGWSDGSYTGLVARGNFEVSAAWESGLAKTFNIKSNKGGSVSVFYPSIGDAMLCDTEGSPVSFTREGRDLITFNTEAGKTYRIYGFTKINTPSSPTGLTYTESASGERTVSWNAVSGATSYNVYVAVDNAPKYTLVGNTASTSLKYTPSAADLDKRSTIAVTAVSKGESERALAYTGEALATEYGNIGAAETSGDNAFAVFAKAKGDSAYTLTDTFAKFTDAIDRARAHLNSSQYSGGKVVVYMFKDNSNSGTANGGGYNGAFDLVGELTVDLGGNTLTSIAPRLLGFEARASGYDKASDIVFKNGTITTEKPIIELFGSAGKYSGEKICRVGFEGVTFKTPSAKATFKAFTSRGSYGGEQKAELDLSFTDCVFDYGTDTKVEFASDSTAVGAVELSLSFFGSEINAKITDSFIIASGFGSEDTLASYKNNEGKRLALTLGYTESCPKLEFLTESGKLSPAAISTDKSKTVYTLNSVKTSLGYSPESVSGKTFIVFVSDIYIGSFDTYYEAINRVKVLSYPNADGIFRGSSFGIYMARDYVHTDNVYDNFSQIQTSLTVDLGGNTLIQKTNYIFNLVAKAINNTQLDPTTVLVRNGRILTNDKPIMRISSNGASGNFGYIGTKTFDFSFIGVSFDKNEFTSSHHQIVSVDSFREVTSGEGSKNADFKASFTDCSFAAGESILFDLSVSDYVDADIKIIGGEILASDPPAYGILTPSDSSDKLTFLKNGEGEYTTLTAPLGIDAPLLTYNGGTLEFIKKEEGEGSVTYALHSAGLNSYLPKMSFAFGEYIAMRVYIPKDKTLAFTLDGIEYTDLAALGGKVAALQDGKDYYLIEIPLSAFEAARRVTLLATVECLEGSASGSFGFSLMDYAENIGDASASELTLIKDALSYVRAAYAYFGKTDAEAMERISAVLGEGYDEANLPSAGEGVLPSAGALSGATYILLSSPKIRFYIPEGKEIGDYDFYIGEEKLEATLGKDSFGRYAELTLSASDIAATVSVSYGGSPSGGYNVFSYLSFANSGDSEALKTLVSRFIRYAESAAASRSAVSKT